MTALLEAWTSVEALWAAARRAARGKRQRPGVARVLLELEGTVLRLQRELRAGSWSPGVAATHVIHDGKRRTISVAPFEDRIVHHALCAAIGPRLDRHLIGDCYACRPGRGTHAAVRRAVRWARCYRFFTRLDVRKFFPSIDHEVLLAQLRRHIDCPVTLAVCARIIAVGAVSARPVRWYFPGDDLFTPFERAVGLPIGNLTSQHFANRFLSPIDHKAKERLHIRPYLRYMDDMLMFSDDRDQLTEQANVLEDACARQRLALHTWEVMPTRQGVGFLGFRILPDHIRVRRSTVRRARRRIAGQVELARADRTQWPALTRSIQATFAHWKHASSWRLRTQMLDELGLLHGAPEAGTQIAEREKE